MPKLATAAILAVVWAHVPHDAKPAGREATPRDISHRLRSARIVVWKASRRLELFSRGEIVRSYRVGLGLNPVPPKRREGDHATPEGDYYICNKNSHSHYYLSLGISYPGPADAERGLREGLINKAQHAAILEAARHKRVPPWNTGLGGEVFIHGRGAGSDWTWGCIALDDANMRELFEAVPIGTPVQIRP